MTGCVLGLGGEKLIDRLCISMIRYKQQAQEEISPVSERDVSNKLLNMKTIFFLAFCLTAVNCEPALRDVYTCNVGVLSRRREHSAAEYSDTHEYASSQLAEDEQENDEEQENKDEDEPQLDTEDGRRILLIAPQPEFLYDRF